MEVVVLSRADQPSALRWPLGLVFKYFVLQAGSSLFPVVLMFRVYETARFGLQGWAS
jgi:hypothetical protein